MIELIWKLRAFFWFWRLAGFISWEAAGVLYDSYDESDIRDDPESSVRNELSEWGD